MIRISKTIKQERLRRGMTQEALADYLNTTKQPFLSGKTPHFILILQCYQN